MSEYREHQRLGRVLPDNRLGAVVARWICRRGAHTLFCRGHNRPGHPGWPSR